MKDEFPTFKSYYEAVNSGDPEIIEEILPALGVVAAHGAGLAARGALAAGKVAGRVGAKVAKTAAQQGAKVAQNVAQQGVQVAQNVAQTGANAVKGGIQQDANAVGNAVNAVKGGIQQGTTAVGNAVNAVKGGIQQGAAAVGNMGGETASEAVPVKAPQIPIQHIKRQADATVDSIFANIPPQQKPQVVQHLKNKLMNVQSAK